MAIRVYKVGDAPKATRQKRRRLESTEEWAGLKAKFANGIGQSEEVAIEFTGDDKARLGLKTLKRAFRDLAKSHIRKLHLPYTVDAYTSDDGKEVILVRNEIIMAGRGEARAEHVVAPERNIKKRRRA